MSLVDALSCPCCGAALLKESYSFRCRAGHRFTATFRPAGESDPTRAAVSEGTAGGGRAEDGGSGEGVPGGGSLVLRLIAHPDRKEIGKTFTFTSGED